MLKLFIFPDSDSLNTSSLLSLFSVLWGSTPRWIVVLIIFSQWRSLEIAAHNIYSQNKYQHNQSVLSNHRSNRAALYIYPSFPEVSWQRNVISPSTRISCVHTVNCVWTVWPGRGSSAFTDLTELHLGQDWAQKRDPNPNKTTYCVVVMCFSHNCQVK